MLPQQSWPQQCISLSAITSTSNRLAVQSLALAIRMSAINPKSMAQWLEESSESERSAMDSNDEEFVESLMAVEEEEAIGRIDSAIAATGRKVQRLAMRMGKAQARMAILYAKKRAMKKKLRRMQSQRKEDARNRATASPPGTPAMEAIRPQQSATVPPIGTLIQVALPPQSPLQGAEPAKAAMPAATIGQQAPMPTAAIGQQVPMAGVSSASMTAMAPSAPMASPAMFRSSSSPATGAIAPQAMMMPMAATPRVPAMQAMPATPTVQAMAVTPAMPATAAVAPSTQLSRAISGPVGFKAPPPGHEPISKPKSAAPPTGLAMAGSSSSAAVQSQVPPPPPRPMQSESEFQTMSYTGSGELRQSPEPMPQSAAMTYTDARVAMRASLRNVQTAPVQQSPVSSGINECRIGDYSQYSAEQLQFPWCVENQDCNRSQEWAQQCSVVIKGIPDHATPVDIFPAIFTVDGNLPWYNHEVIAATMPVSREGTGNRGIAFIRWSSPQWAQECVRRFHRREMVGRKLEVAISDWPVKVEIAKRNRTPMLGGIFMFAMAWQLCE